MTVNDRFFAQTFRSRGSYAVKRKSLSHGSADITRHTAERGERHRDKRQAHIIKLVKKRSCSGIVRAGGSHTGNGEPAEHCCKNPDKNYTYNKRRNTVTDYRGYLYRRVTLASAVNGTENTERNGYSERKYRCKNVYKYGVLHRLYKNVLGRSRILITVTEIALKNAVVMTVYRRDAYPAEITNENVLVGSEFFPLLLN